MANNSELCLDCGIQMKQSFAMFNGTKIEALRCGNCGKKLFSEGLALKALQKISAQKLQPIYERRPIKIGQSWAITFPKDIAERFGITKETKLKIAPKLHKNTIEIVKD